MKTFIGIDNGVTGTIGIIESNGRYTIYKTPVRKCLSYTKKKQWVTRIDGTALYNYLFPFSSLSDTNNFPIVFLERPMINPTRFKATVSAIRALESTLIILEMLSFPFYYIDSKEWQKELLPKKLVGPELKPASLEVGKRMFPEINFTKFKDADGLLIAEYCRRKHHT